jgi:hypothetical protein
VYSRLAAFFGFALILASSVACVSQPKGSGAKGQLISTSVPISLYAAARMHGSAGGVSEFNFPMLEIYDGSGALVYRSHEPINNARVLRELPSSIQSLQPRKDAPRLADIIEALPEFKAKEKEILRHHNPVVLSVVLENCHACTVQEDALGEAQQLLLQNSIDVLVVNVAQP